MAHIIPTISPPPLCFSCGNNLPESDFDNYHILVAAISKVQKCSEDCASKIVLDSRLSKPYIRPCCRTMFVGDALEYRQAQAFYDFSKINDQVKF
jgi:DNA-directed RNA polymerase subunit N (RpoN/RPB10)